jgi:hypothetical protein
MIALIDKIDDVDLEDGAGQILSELIKLIDERVDQNDIIDKQDLKNAVTHLMKRNGNSDDIETWIDGLLAALRLLSMGHYRSLLIEERERVGRIDCRIEAMKRFRKRVIGGDGREAPFM